jgi:formamidopyrimidine-DNA glycosylase
MPELPEVETIRNVLRVGGQDSPALLGKRIEALQILWARSLGVPTVAEAQARVVGQILQDIDRRGKYLIFRLSSDSLLVHLRMSGDLWVEPIDAPVEAHVRAIIVFEGGPRLAFNDPRKFGRIWLVNDPQLVVGKLGPEPLGDDFTVEWLWGGLQARRRRLKPLLLDQAFIAGLGNIYTDEALHLAGLHPLLPSHQVTLAQALRLHAAIQAVLGEGIRRNGASIDWVYRGGDFQNYFRAYDRKKQPCPACGTPIQRIVVGQRGTYFCPCCQPLERV